MPAAWTSTRGRPADEPPPSMCAGTTIARLQTFARIGTLAGSPPHFRELAETELAVAALRELTAAERNAAAREGP